MSWATNAELPSRVRKVLPPAAQTYWRNAANDVLAKREGQAAAIRRAWYAVSEGWEQGEGQQWVRKFDPSQPRDDDGKWSDTGGGGLVVHRKDDGLHWHTPATGKSGGPFAGMQALITDAQDKSGVAIPDQPFENPVAAAQAKATSSKGDVGTLLKWANRAVTVGLIASIGLPFGLAAATTVLTAMAGAPIGAAASMGWAALGLGAVTHAEAIIGFATLKSFISGLIAKRKKELAKAAGKEDPVLTMLQRIMGELNAADVDTIQKLQARSLYVCRYVQNAAEIIKWAKAQGFETTLPAEEMHVTVVYSKSPADWMKASTTWGGPDGVDGTMTIPAGGPRLVEPLGNGGAVVLLFGSHELTWRNEAIRRDTGASSDYNVYQPHITISYDAADLDLSKVEPYTGKIVLGPEIFKEVGDKSDYVEKQDEVFAKFQAASGGDVRIVKVDPGLGLVFGWAVICKHQGQDYYDLNRDRDTGELVPEHIPEGAMLEAATDFMEKSRVHKEMHEGEQQGTVVFAFPMTSDIAKSLKIETNGTTGLLVAMKPNPAMLAKYKSGALTGFSIGGSRQKLREVLVPEG